MSNVFDELESGMISHANKIKREADTRRREKVDEEKQKLDEQQKTEKAKQLAVVERQKTLNWAWAAASLLSMSELPTSRPEVWEYTYTIMQKRRFFGRKAVELTGIAAYGWHVLDWQNTRYHPSPRHTLILTPEDERNSGVYLRFFSQPWNYNGGFDQIRPSDVHELSKEPLSASDMPWPGFIDKSTGSDHVEYAFGVRKPPPLKAPWKSGKRSIEFDGFDDDQEYYLLNRRTTGDSNPYERSANDGNAKLHPKTKYDYDEYRKTGTENAIRRAITQVAAEKLLVKLEDMILEIKRQAEQNDQLT